MTGPKTIHPTAAANTLRIDPKVFQNAAGASPLYIGEIVRTTVGGRVQQAVDIPGPQTDAGRALVEWAANAMPTNQQDIWLDHALAIEAEARSQGAAAERERTDEAFRVALTAIRETSTDPSARDLAASLLALLLDEVSA